MNVKVFQIGSLPTNCYVIWNDLKEAVVIDVAENGFEAILEYIVNNGLSLKAVLLTHGHFDHVGGVDVFLDMYYGSCDVKGDKETKIPVYVDKADLEYCSIAEYCAKQWGLKCNDCKSAQPIPNSEIQLGDINVKVINTPGHSEGSVIYIINDEIMASGDTLFYGSIGRTDFPQGSPIKIKQSLELIKKLEGNYRVLPGHGRETTLDREKETNFWLR